MNIGYDKDMILPKLIITKLVLLPTERNYDGIYRRDYKIHLTSENMNNLTNLMYNNPCGVGYKLSNIEIANNLSDMINYNPLGVNISIPNGWGTKRCIFILIADTTDAFQRFYIQGYTDYDDPSLSGYMDPEMTFYINAIHSFTRCMNSLNMPFLKHDYSYNVLADITNENQFMYGNNTCNNLLIRPCDVYTGLSGYTIYEEGGINNALYNTTAYYDLDPKASNTTNLDPISYLDKTINSYIQAKSITRPETANNMYLENTAFDTFTNARGFLVETAVKSNPFIIAISIINNLGSTTKFKLKDLSVIDPSLDADSANRLDYYYASNPYKLETGLVNPLLTVHQGENQLQPTPEIMISNRIINTVGAYMTETMITSFSFSFTNMVAIGIPNLVITNVRTILDGVDDISIKHFIGILQTKIETFIVPYLMSFGVGIMVHCQVELFVDSTIAITYDSNPERVYIFPTFANGLFNSAITNQFGYTDMISTVDTLTDKITEIRDDVLGTSLYSNLDTVNY